MPLPASTAQQRSPDCGKVLRATRTQATAACATPAPAAAVPLVVCPSTGTGWKNSSGCLIKKLPSCFRAGLQRGLSLAPCTLLGGCGHASAQGCGHQGSWLLLTSLRATRGQPRSEPASEARSGLMRHTASTL